MKQRNSSRLSLLVSITFAISLFLMPIMASAQEEQNDNNTALGSVGTVINSSNNEVKGTGAMAGGGNRNAAFGIGSVVVNSSGNIIDANGAFAGNGNDNTAVGIGAVVIGTANPGIDVNQYWTGGQNLVSGTGARADKAKGAKVIGYGAQAGNGDYNTAMGSGAAAGNSNFNTAIGANAQAVAGNSVALGAGSIAYESNTVSVGSYGNERRITNLAPGVYDTDAVNMSQLRGLDNRVNRVGATAFAFSALAPMAYDPKEPTQYSAGLGTYNGTGAVAIGVYHYTKPDVMLNAAIGMSNDGWEKAARVGITWRTGGPREKELVPAVSTEVPVKENIVDRTKKIIAEMYAEE